jgi:protein-S-isoprenylcysteine O-methyltransferase Ste14
MTSDSSHWDDPWAGGAGWVAGQFALLVAIVLTGLWLDDWPIGSSLAMALVGIAVALLGLVLFAAGIAAHGGPVTPLPRPREPVQIVESSIYRFARHPIYGGVILVAVGFALWRSSVIALVLTGGLALLFQRKARLEEEWLTRLAPRYADYSRRVRRAFIPFVF